MQRAKVFFYVSLGVLALAGAFHLGAQTAESQSPILAVSISNRGSNPGDGLYALVENGDVYQVSNASGWNPVNLGNIFGSPVHATKTI